MKDWQSIANARLKEIERLRKLNKKLKQQLKESKMTTLKEILTGSIGYDSSWAIYAQKIEGKFELESPARTGQKNFDNGGLLDDMEYFCSNEQAVDNRDSWIGSYEDYDDDYNFTDEWEDAAIQLIDNLNQS